MGKEKEIDLLEVAGKVWASRRLILKWTGYAALAGLVVGFSIPAEYTVSVKMVAEDGKKSAASSGLNQLMDLAGVDMMQDGGYGIGVLMYPQVVASLPFLADLRKVEVAPGKLEKPVTLYEYISEYQKKPWWSSVMSAPVKVLGWVFSLFKAEATQPDDAFNIGQLTQKQTNYVKSMRERIGIDLDKKNAIITLNVVMQDPSVAAVVADSVVSELKDYIIRYRTDKARQDMEYCQKTFEESKKQYYAAQRRYADFVDQNRNIARQTVKIEQERLASEMDLAYGVYTATAQQLESAKLKVQQQTPCVTVVEPATIPLKKTKPKKATILLTFVFLGMAVSSGYVVARNIFGTKKD